MKKIATHNSVTGERGKGFLSWLVAPFSRCQSKSIKKQYESGCRYFDLRLKKKKGEWVMAHGLWTASVSPDDVLSFLNHKVDEEVYVSITYEGEATSYDMQELQGKISGQGEGKMKIVDLNIKKPKWRCYKQFGEVSCRADYTILDGRDWRTYLPLPWLWNKLYHPKHEFNDTTFTMVDFL